MKKQNSKKKTDGKKNKAVRKKKASGKNRGLILSMIIIIPLACLLGIYMTGISHYRNRFLNGTVIDHVDVSGMTIAELEEQIQDYSLRVIERQAQGPTLEEEILGSEIGISYISTEPLQNILQAQNGLLWFLNRNMVYETGALPFYEEEALVERIDELRGFREDFVSDPEDAHIGEYVPGSGFEIIAEKQGNRLNRDRTIEVLKAAVEGMEERVDLEEAGCYESPDITSEDPELLETYARLQSYVNVVITYTFGTQKEVLDGNTIAGWVRMDGNQVTFDHDLVGEYVASLRKKYDTIFRPRKFKTSYGTELAIDQGDYGWWMNTDEETKELIEMLERGESGERVPVYRQTAASYETPDYGNSYVEINLTAQHLFLYQNGECVLESDFVSGNPVRGNGTPVGIYGITYKERDATLKGENYRTPVSYWMPFNNNVGMHDATWRSEFGGNIYLTNGSHGCINLPYSVAQEIYGYVEKGTPVICYRLPGTEPAPADPQPAEPGAESPEGSAVNPETGQPEGSAVNPEVGQTEGTAAEPGAVAPEGTAAQPGAAQPGENMVQPEQAPDAAQ